MVVDVMYGIYTICSTLIGCVASYIFNVFVYHMQCV